MPSVTMTGKSVEELELELVEAERMAAGIREQLEQARWLREYEGEER